MGLLLLGIGLYRTRTVPRVRALVPLSVLPESIAIMVLGAALGSGLASEVVFAIGLIGFIGLSLVVLGYTLRKTVARAG